jgi:hypothetical protein
MRSIAGAETFELARGSSQLERAVEHARASITSLKE